MTSTPTSESLTVASPQPPRQRDDHPLTRDPQPQGSWGRIDRWSRTFSEWLNPILIKEARQSLKSRQFVVTFFLLLVASCLWTIMGVATNAPNVYYLPSGDHLLAGYYFVLAIPLIGLVPLAAHRSLAAEIDEGTFEMLMVTQLTSTRIVLGKLNSAMLQMLIYFAAIVPCLAFSYLLRGVELPTIAVLVVIVFFTALLVTSLARLLAAVATNRATQTLALLAILGVIVFAEFACGAASLGGILYDSGGSNIETLMFVSIYLVIGGSCLLLFIKAAAAKIAPVTENRSTVLRYIMLSQNLL